MNRPIAPTDPAGRRALARSALAALLALSLLALAACGEKTEPQAGGERKLERYRVLLDWYPNADHAGLFAAQASGEFERAGLDVELVEPSDATSGLKALQAGRVDLAVSYEPELLKARDEGAKLLSVAALVHQPLTSLMAIGSAGVRSPADLRGKTVGTAGLWYQDVFLDHVLEEAGVPRSSVRRVAIGTSLTAAMLAKRVDATLAAFLNVEGVELERRGKNPYVAPVDRLGVPTYDELILVARRKSLDAAAASRLRRFLQAVARATAAATRDPSLAADALADADRGSDPRRQLAQVKKTLPALVPSEDDVPFGYQNADEWHAFGEWLYDRKALDRRPAAEDAFTNEFLPGEGVARNSAEPGS